MKTINACVLTSADITNITTTTGVTATMMKTNRAVNDNIANNDVNATTQLPDVTLVTT